MPKKLLTYDDWSGGINNKTAPAKIPRDQVTDLVNVMVDKPGRIRTMGQMVGYVYGSPLPSANLLVDWDAEIGVDKDGSNNVSWWDGRDEDLAPYRATPATGIPLWVSNQLNSVYPIIRFDASTLDYLIENDLASALNGEDISFTCYLVFLMNEIDSSSNFWGFAENGTSDNHHVYGVNVSTVTMIDDFEDGNITGWTGDTASFSADSVTTIDGSYSGKIEATDALKGVTSPSASGATNDMEFKVRIDTKTGNALDNVAIFFYEPGGTSIGYIVFPLGGGAVTWENTTTTLLSSWSVDTNYTIQLQWDFSNDQVDVVINGTTVATGIAFDNTASSFEDLLFRINTSNSEDTSAAWIDTIRTVTRSYQYTRTDGTGTSNSVSGGTPETASYHIHTVVFDGSTPDVLIREDGSLLVNSGLDVGSITADTFWIGGMQQDTNFGNMDLARLVFYDVAHNTNQIHNIETQLNTQYGL